MSLKRKNLTIAVCLDVRQKASREIVRGVMRCVVANGGADVMLLGNHPCNDGFERAAGGEPDILIAGWDTLCESADRALLKSRKIKAAVFFGGWKPEEVRFPAVQIDSDDHGIGVAAARIMMRSGFRSFAYLGAPHGDRWSAARRDSFSAALAASGFGLAGDYSPEARRTDWKRDRRRLAQWVTGLPKPCAVLAAFDQRARHLISVCRDSGVPVPQQVQVLGVDDEEYICENEVPSLSSISIDFCGAAQRAMRAVFAYIEQGTPLPPTILAGVAGYTERLSTGDMGRTGERVNRARDIIRRHATEGISSADVARMTGGSLRLLESDFRIVLGRTVAAELRETRLKEAARLLEDTRVPLGDIAARIGFGNQRSLANAFKRRFGCPMRQWRAGSRS